MSGRIFDLYRAIAQGSSCSWKCPLCESHSMIRRSDGEFSLLFTPIDQTMYSEHGDQVGHALLTITIRCPSCNKVTVQVGEYSACSRSIDFDSSDESYQLFSSSNPIFEGFVYPKNCDSDQGKFFFYVPPILLNDYAEMCELIRVSPNAAVVFGRRCLERLIIAKWPEVRSLRDNEKIPHLSEMIGWLKKNQVGIRLDILASLKTLGDKAVHIFDAEEDIKFTHTDAILIKEVIEDFFTKYFEEFEEQKNREKRLIELSQSTIALAHDLETNSSVKIKKT